MSRTSSTTPKEETAQTPSWYQDYLTSYLAAEAHAFILHEDIDGYAYETLSQRRFLISTLAQKRSVVVSYDLARGIVFADPAMRKTALAYLKEDEEETPTPQSNAFEAALAGIGPTDNVEQDDPFTVRKPL